MLKNIKTSKANKEVVTYLTNKLNLGAENVIARLSFAYSLAKDRRMDLTKIKDSGGKEYSAKVLFGDQTPFYTALISIAYEINRTDKDIARYIKMHIDDGLDLINKEVSKKSSITGTEFLINEIEKGIIHLK